MGRGGHWPGVLVMSPSSAPGVPSVPNTGQWSGPGKPRLDAVSTVDLETKALNEGSLRFHNHREGLVSIVSFSHPSLRTIHVPISHPSLRTTHVPISCLLTVGSTPV